MTKQAAGRRRRKTTATFRVYEDKANSAWTVGFCELSPVKGQPEYYHRYQGVASAYYPTRAAALKGKRKHEDHYAATRRVYLEMR